MCDAYLSSVICGLLGMYVAVSVRIMSDCSCVGDVACAFAPDKSGDWCSFEV